METRTFIFDLDDPGNPKQVGFCDQVDQLMSPDTFVSSGFKLEYSYHNGDRDDQLIERKKIVTNELCNLFIEKFTEYDVRDDGHKGFKLTSERTFAKVNRCFSEIDLFEMMQIAKCMRRKRRIQGIDPQAIVSTYQGHSIFSIFFDQVKVYE